MANAPNTGSQLSFGSGANRTSTAISTNILIMVGNIKIGAVQKLSIDEKRSLKMIDEVGTDGHVDSVPQSSTNITGSCERIRFSRLRIAEAFGRGFVHASSQAYPFDIIIIDKQKADTGLQISTVIKNVWIEGISYAYNADNWVISENMTWQAERIFSILNGGSSSSTTGGKPVALGGEIGLTPMIIPVEREADTGTNGRGGSLDASGLIDLGGTGDFF